MNYKETAQWLTGRFPEIPVAGIMLGTGLGLLTEMLENKTTIPYENIPGFVKSTSPSHAGNLIYGFLSGRAVLCLQGRFHLYEGYSAQQVVFPVRVMASMGIKTLIVTNASGSLRKDFEPGNIVMLTDHINFMGTNPLVGTNDDGLGERFPSMNIPYSARLHAGVKIIAEKHGIELKWGTYLAVTGPSLETKSECEMFAKLGADLVGMSTVPEVIVARHAGMEVLGISVVTNYSNLFHNLAHSQEEIRHNAGKAASNVKKIISALMPEV